MNYCRYIFYDLYHEEKSFMNDSQNYIAQCAE